MRKEKRRLCGDIGMSWGMPGWWSEHRSQKYSFCKQRLLEVGIYKEVSTASIRNVKEDSVLPVLFHKRVRCLSSHFSFRTTRLPAISPFLTLSSGS